MGHPPAPLPLSAAPIAFDGLTKYYGAHKALDSLTLDVPQGSIFALLGRNGAGKTTAMRCLMGFMQPTRGEARLLGHVSTQLPSAVRGRIGFVAEGEKLIPWMRIDQLVRFQAATMATFDPELCRGHLKRLRLVGKQKVKSLSRGQRAQLALALALAQRPDVAILDDPALGLDTVVRREFLEVMIDLIQGEGHTVLFTSHILNDVERVADRVAMLVDGVLRVDAPLDVIKERIRRFRASFDGTPPSVSDLPGLVRVVRRDNSLTVTVAQFADRLPERLRALGATTVSEHPMTLEDLFVEYTATSPWGDD